MRSSSFFVARTMSTRPSCRSTTTPGHADALLCRDGCDLRIRIVDHVLVGSGGQLPCKVQHRCPPLARWSGLAGTLPVIVYMHGGGWILGNAGTHDRLVRELAIGARAALAFVEYPNSPEARYPTAIEQGYATAQWIIRNGASKGLDASRMAVAGESVGGNMTAALALMAKERGDVTFVQQSDNRSWILSLEPLSRSLSEFLGTLDDSELDGCRVRLLPQPRHFVSQTVNACKKATFRSHIHPVCESHLSQLRGLRLGGGRGWG